MGKKQAYRPLTEAEKRYIDRLVNEAWRDTIGNVRNSITNAYQNFHDKIHGNNNDGGDNNDNDNQNNNNAKSYDPINASPWKVYWDSRKKDQMPTERSQWAQFRDWMADRFTNGEYSKRKNAYLNQKMRQSMQKENGEKESYWLGKLLNYWSYHFKQNVNGTNAAYKFILWLNQVSGVESDLIADFNEAYNRNVRNGISNGDTAVEFFQFIDSRMGYNNFKYRDICDYIITNYTSSNGKLSYNGFLNWMNGQQQNTAS